MEGNGEKKVRWEKIGRQEIVKTKMERVKILYIHNNVVNRQIRGGTSRHLLSPWAEKHTREKCCKAK